MCAQSLVVHSRHRGEKGRGETEGVSLPSQLERTPQLGSWWLHWVHLLLCPSKIYRHWNKNTFLILMVYSVLFNNVLKLNLFLYKYVVEIQLHSNGICLLSHTISIPYTTYIIFYCSFSGEACHYQVTKLCADGSDPAQFFPVWAIHNNGSSIIIFMLSVAALYYFNIPLKPYHCTIIIVTFYIQCTSV